MAAGLGFCRTRPGTHVQVLNRRGHAKPIALCPVGSHVESWSNGGRVAEWASVGLSETGTDIEPVRRPARLAIMLALAHKIQQAIDCGAGRDRAEVARRLGITPGSWLEQRAAWGASEPVRDIQVSRLTG